MLDGAFTSPKIRRLAVILDLPWPHALGLAGLLWRFTAKHAPTGEIGRHDDEEIAAALEWPGAAEDLVAALIRCRLLDATPGASRLIVHDWPDHAPRYVSATLKRNGTRFSAHYDRDPTTDDTTGRSVDPSANDSGDRTTYTSSSASTYSESSSSSITSTRKKPVPERVVVAIWNLWVPGRKTSKVKGLAQIKESIRRLAKTNGMSIEDAARYIAERTQKDASRYKRDVEKGQTELKFVPLASTYFNQERWNDDDERPDVAEIRRESITDEIQRTRSKLGQQLDPSS